MPELTTQQKIAVGKSVNEALKDVNRGFHPTIPIKEIEEILKANDLNPAKIKSQIHGDMGRLHEEVGEDLYFTMTWYKFESTGRWEVVAYISTGTINLDLPNMKGAERAKALKAANKRLAQISSHDANSYYNEVPVREIFDALEENGFDVTRLGYGQFGGSHGRLHEPVGSNTYLSLTWTKMGSGRYEIVAYAS